MSTRLFPACRFDGRRAQGLPVIVHIEAPDLIVETAEGAVVDRERLDRAVVSEPLDHAPRLVSLSSGATLEVPDGDRAFGRALDQIGMRDSLAVRLQEQWVAVVVALLILVGLLAAGYFKGLPAAARWAAFAVPPELEARMGEQILSVLDTHYLQPSRLDPATRAGIAERFARGAARISPTVAYRLEFRTAAKDPINAMALPGGIIILLDGLVKFADDEDGVVGVLGHELGHVAHKHSLRNILQSTGVGVVASLLWGDFSGVAASVPVVIGILSYSRDAEREADEFAIEFLRAQDMSLQPLYDFFSEIRDLESRRGANIPGFLSTHPSTDERLERLRREFQ
jgi:predicted Zn-dependent protease